MSEDVETAFAKVINQANRLDPNAERIEPERGVCVCEKLLTSARMFCTEDFARRLCHHYTGCHP